MLFSERFGLTKAEPDDWFDPILSIDTPLFLDPFLLFAQEQEPFVGSHHEIVQFFDSVLRMIADSGANPTSVHYLRAERLLLFPEVQELCLGYAAEGTKGAGSGVGFARVMAAALTEAIAAGITKITHFEEVSILREGIGADRISDITAGLLRRRLSEYTTAICRRHGVPTEPARYPNGYYDHTEKRWKPLEVTLPRNPYNGRPILLVPRGYLRDLPTINPDEFWEFCYTYENDTIRREFNLDVMQRLRKAEIVELARRHPEFVQSYVEHVERRGSRPYDMSKDKKGYLRWYDASATYTRQHPLQLQFTSLDEFLRVVQLMVEAYVHYVEQNAGWRLLYNDNSTPKAEKAGQLLFLGIVKHYCQANNIDISPEVNIGRGPVDFKVSQGYVFRALLELKLAKNSRFWNGLIAQLPTYLEAERVKHGYFVVIAYTDADLDRVANIQKAVTALNASLPYRMDVLVVDARPKLSASKL